MRIAFLLPINGISGGIYVAYQHAHFLASQGHEITIVFVSEENGQKVTAFPDFKLKTRSLRDAVTRRVSFDAVVATWWETFYEMFSIESQHYFYFCQSDERRFYPSPLSFEVPFVQKTYCDDRIGIITEAKWIKNWLEKDYNATVEYAPNGIDTSRFHPNVAPKEPRGPKTRVLIEGLGGKPYKRIDLAFRVANRLPGIEVWFVSTDGVTQPHWKYDRVFKRVPLDEMPSIYRACDVLLKLSVVEGFFGPPLEMMACGGTAVVTRVTGYDEYIRPEENAVVVELDDEEGAYQALERVVRDSNLRANLSQNGLATAQSMDWKVKCPLFEKALLNLVKRSKPISIQAKTDYQILNQIIKRSNHVSEIQNWRPFKVWKGLRHRLLGN